MLHTYCQECGFPIAQYGADIVPAEYAGRWFHLAPPECAAPVPATVGVMRENEVKGA